MNNRNEGYVPDGLFPQGPTDHRVLVGPSDRPRIFKHGKADELNRDQTWHWVKISGDQEPGTPAELDGGAEHWSQFRGHHVLVDIAYRQQNRREVNYWKGRDEIRAEGAWVLRFNRTQVWEGWCTTNLLWDLHRIADTAMRLREHPVIDWMSDVPYARQLEGRKVWFRKTPAIISRVLMDQGCVMLQPDGASVFPPPQSQLDHLEQYDSSDDERVKVDLLDPHVWWFRD